MRKIFTEPSVEPISSTEAKLYLKVDDTTDDTLIATLIKSARKYAERYMGRALITQVWEYYFDEFPDEFELYMCPVNSITSITYYDSNNVLQTLASTVYTLDGVSAPARIYLNPSQSWPDTADRKNAVIVKASCGYGAAGTSVPEPILNGIYLHLGHLYENRQDVTVEKMNELPYGSKSLYDFYKVY